MNSEALKQSLSTIRDYVSGIKGLKEDGEVQLVRSQLRMIEKSIRQFEKNGIQVPEGLMSDKLSLESRIGEIRKGPEEISLLYQELLDLIIDAARILRRRPDSDFRRRLRELRKREVPKDVLRKSIIAALREMGGSGHERDVLRSIEDKLREQFSSADLDRPYGRSARWQMNVREERNIMVEEGILTPDSKRKEWSLSR